MPATSAATAPGAFDRRRKQEIGDELRRLVVQGRRDMAVDAERDRDRRMAEALLHDARMDTSLERERGPSVPEPLECQARQAIAMYSAEKRVADGVGPKPPPLG